MKMQAFVFCLAFAFAGAASAAKAPPPSVDAGRDDLAAQRAAVVQEMEKGERFAEITDEDKAAVFAALDRMEKVLGGRRIGDLPEAEKVALINDQELINALLTKANRDSRLQCRREKRVGSHRTTSTCRTVAEWRRASEQSREDIERRRGMGDILPQEKPGGGRGLRGGGGS